MRSLPEHKLNGCSTIRGMTAPPWVVVADLPELQMALVRAVAPLAASGVRSRGIWTLGVPGGSVAEQMLVPLARAALSWDRAHVFWCDERAVKPDDADSNWAQANRLWRMEAPGRAARLYRMPADNPDLESAAHEYGAQLQSVAGTPPQMDVVLLGVGEDGHVASVFPGRHPSRDEAPVQVELHAPKPPPRRMSLSLEVLAGARLTCVVAFGAGKARIVRHALDPHSDLPVALVLRGAASPLLLVDRDAGRELP